MAKAEYRIVDRYGHALAVKLYTGKNYVAVNCKGAAPFLIPVVDWESGETVPGGGPDA